MQPIETTRCEEVGGGLDDAPTRPLTREDPGPEPRDRPWHSVPWPRPVAVS